MDKNFRSVKSKWFPFLKKNWGWILLWGFILAIHLWSLMRYPFPHTDEAWLTSRAWAFLHTGIPYGVLDAGILDTVFEKYWLTYQWLVTAVQSLALRLAQSPSLLALRLLSLAWGGVLLWANWRIARSLKSPRFANISTVLLVLTPAFFFSAHQARYDVMAAALAFSGLACFFMASQGFRPNSDLPSKPGWKWKPFVMCAVGGVCLTLAIETHLNSLIFIAPLFLMLFLFRLENRGINAPLFWGYALGGLLGTAFYFFIHIFPDPASFLEQFRFYLGPNHAVPLLTTLKGILFGLTETFRILLVVGPPLLLLSLLGLFKLWKQDQPLKKFLFWFNLVLIVSSAFIIPHKYGYYTILLAPAAVWLAAYFLDEFQFQKWSGRPLDYLSRVLIWGTLAAFVGLSLFQLRTDGTASYQRTVSQVMEVIEPGDRIMGPQVYWFGATQHEYYSWEILFLYNRIHPGTDLQDSFQQFQPDIFIMDEIVDILTSDEIPQDSPWYHYRLPRQELFALLDQQAILVKEFTAENYGKISIYRFQK